MRFDEAYAEMVHINEFRNSALYGGKVNSIAEWMLSPEWTTPIPQTPANFRGLIRYTGGFTGRTNQTVGEINVRETPPIL